MNNFKEIDLKIHCHKDVKSNSFIWKYGKTDKIIGVHTNKNLKYYQKANNGDIFYI